MLDRATSNDPVLICRDPYERLSAIFLCRFTILDHFFSRALSTKGPVVSKIKNELLKSIYAGVTNDEVQRPPGSRFHFEKSPYFQDNLVQQKTIANLQNELMVLDAKV